MKITELLDLKGIELNVSVSSKDEAINKLIDLMCATGKISDKDAYKEGILAREALTSTGIGEGIAIPHAQVAAVKAPGLAKVAPLVARKPPTKPTNKPGLSAILIAMKPARIGTIRLNATPPIVFKKADAGVIVPKLPLPEPP